MSATSPAERSPRSKRLKTWLIIDTVVSALALPLAIFWGLMSGMSTTTTDDAAFANAYVLINLTFPVALVICLAGAWTAFALRRERAAWIAMILPLPWLFVSIAMMANWPST